MVSCGVRALSLPWLDGQVVGLLRNGSFFRWFVWDERVVTSPFETVGMFQLPPQGPDLVIAAAVPHWKIIASTCSDDVLAISPDAGLWAGGGARWRAVLPANQLPATQFSSSAAFSAGVSLAEFHPLTAIGMCCSNRWLFRTRCGYCGSRLTTRQQSSGPSGPSLFSALGRPLIAGHKC